MKCYITDAKGVCRSLPELLDWDLQMGTGEACGAFELSFACTPGMRQALGEAVRFHAEYGGERVFTGVVDEFEMTADSRGMTAAISGRSMAALLLDNEAEAATYYGASLELILKKHVYPLGITDVRYSEMPPVGLLAVSSGTSHWAVLRQFCQMQGGITPYFDGGGALILSAVTGRTRQIDGTSAVCSQVYRARRYGIISQVTVKNRARGTALTVVNGEFPENGGSCRRVINVTRDYGSDAMRRAGEYQIEQSKKDARLCVVTLQAMFAAQPGDTVFISSSPLGITGSFFVREARCRGSRDGAFTTLTLAEQEV